MPFQNTLMLNIEEIRTISNYAHWIHIVRGYHHDFLNEHYPGWGWNDFLPVLDAADLIGRHEEGHACVRLMQGICMRPGVAFVELDRTAGTACVSRVIYEEMSGDTK